MIGVVSAERSDRPFHVSSKLLGVRVLQQQAGRTEVIRCHHGAELAVRSGEPECTPGAAVRRRSSITVKLCHSHCSGRPAVCRCDGAAKQLFSPQHPNALRPERHDNTLHRGDQRTRPQVRRQANGFSHRPLGCGRVGHRKRSVWSSPDRGDAAKPPAGQLPHPERITPSRWWDRSRSLPALGAETAKSATAAAASQLVCARETPRSRADRLLGPGRTA